MAIVEELEREVSRLTSAWRFKYPMKLRVDADSLGEKYTFVMFAPGRSFQCAFSITRQVLASDPVGVVRRMLEDMRNELNQQGLLLANQVSPDARHYRVIERVSKGQGNSWSMVSEGVLWEGTDPRQYHGKYGQQGGAFMRKTENVLQIFMVDSSGKGGRWDTVDPKTAISRFKGRSRGQGFNSPRQQTIHEDNQRYAQPQKDYGFSGRISVPAKHAPDPTADVNRIRQFLTRDHVETASERAERRRREAQINQRAKAQATLGDKSAAAAHMARTRGDREKEERLKQEAERAERARRAQEEADRKKADMRRIAAASFNGVQTLIGNAEDAWRDAAVKEAAARDEQVEDELFGGGGEGIMTSVIWSGAEQAALKLLEFAQARVDEARARQEGKGAALIDEDEDEVALEAAAINEGAHEHVSEGEFEGVVHDRVQKETAEAQSLGAPDVDELPDTGDDAMNSMFTDEQMDAVVNLTKTG
jgi:hypothetical protein